MKKLGPTELKRLHREWRRQTPGRVALLLDGVQNPFNVGSLVRTAAALRIEHLYLAGAACPPSHPKAHKTSLGTERYVRWSVHEDPADALAAAAGSGFSVVGLELTDAAVPLHEAPLDGDVCIAVGHEDRGLSAVTLSGCAAVAFVPQLGRVASLNVAHAAAVAVYEARRRAWTSGVVTSELGGDPDSTGS